MVFTGAQIRNFKPQTRRIRRSHVLGLFIEVMPSGRKHFRLVCRFNEIQRVYFIGEYSGTKLANARLKAAEYRCWVKEGIDLNPDRTDIKVKSERTAPLSKDIAKDF